MGKMYRRKVLFKSKFEGKISNVTVFFFNCIAPQKCYLGFYNLDSPSNLWVVYVHMYSLKIY